MRRTSTPLQKYIKKTSRYLICSKETKQHMLDGLYKEMLESNSPFSDEGQIVSIYGTPKDFADSLMQGVKSSEKEQVLQHRKHLFRCGILIAAIAVVCAFVATILIVRHYRNVTPIYYQEDIVDDSSSAISDESVTWD